MVSELQQLRDSVREASEDFVLATVVGVLGSTYRLPGAKQLISVGGLSVGTVSGGCLDTDLQRVAEQVVATGTPRFVRYDLTADDDEVWGFGIGCNGVTETLVEPSNTAKPLIELLAVAADEAIAVAVVTVIDGPAIGSRLVVHGDGTVQGGLGSPADNREGTALATAALEAGRHATRELASTGHRVFVEVQVPPPLLVICGAGHDAIPLARFGAELGWRVTVIDDRAAYLTPERFPQAADLVLAKPSELATRVGLDRLSDVVVMSHNYVRDVEYLRALLGSPVRYIGMLGPRARTERILAELRGDGVEPTSEDRDRLFAPAGLDVGAEGPEQIAWAILAEMLAVARDRPGGSLRDRKGGIHQKTGGEKA